MKSAISAVHGVKNDGTTERKLYRADGSEYLYDSSSTTNGGVAVELLKDYVQPGSDCMVITAQREVSLVTANIDSADNPSYNDGKGDVYTYHKGSNSGSQDDRATITRGAPKVDGDDNTLPETPMFLVAGENTTLSLANVTLDGNKDNYQPQVDGSIVRVETGELVIGDKAELCNAQAGDGRSGNQGGAVYLAGEGTALTMSGGEIHDCAAFEGGAIYLAPKATMDFSGGSIAGNTALADGNGAGIYLSEQATLQLSDNPSFARTYTDAQGQEHTASGNHVQGHSWPDGDTPTNGFDSYATPRQDIYLAGYLGMDGDDPAAATSLVVTGPLAETVQPGSIWIWSEMAAEDASQEDKDNNHYQQLSQFAVFADSLLGTDAAGQTTLSLTEAELLRTYAAFRNAWDDTTTANGTDGYLTGAAGPNGESPRYLFWTGNTGKALVVLRKIDAADGLPIAGARFDLLKSDGRTPVADDAVNIETTSLDDEPGGLIYVGKLSAGTYYLHELEAASGYEGTDTWFSFSVTKDEAGSFHVSALRGPYASYAEAKAAGD
jgi:hypothetical protein